MNDKTTLTNFASSLVIGFISSAIGVYTTTKVLEARINNIELVVSANARVIDKERDNIRYIESRLSKLEGKF